MKNGIYSSSLLFFSLLGMSTQAQVRLSANKQSIEISNYSFTPSFTILYNAVDPAMALKPAGIKKVEYNVLTWKVKDSTKADFHQKKINASVAGDGFDDRILRGKNEWRTANIFHAGQSTTIKASGMEQKGDTLFFRFPANDGFELKAYLLTNIKPFPVLRYTFSPLKAGYYSIGYTGAPSFSPEKAAAIWQPLIWQEKRIPDAAYLTPAFMATYLLPWSTMAAILSAYLHPRSTFLFSLCPCWPIASSAYRW